ATSRRAKSATYISAPPRSGSTFSWHKAICIVRRSQAHPWQRAGSSRPIIFPLLIKPPIVAPANADRPAQNSPTDRAACWPRIDPRKAQPVAGGDADNVRRVEQLREVFEPPPRRGQRMMAQAM